MKAIVIALLGALAIVGSASAAKPRVSPADRQAINATLDTFVNHAVKRHDAGAAFDVVTDAMRGGMTRKQWSKGSIPVYPYPAAGQHFHQWTIQYRTSEELAIELLLSPRASSKEKLGQYLFHVYLQPAQGQWLVDSFMPAATFAPIGGPARVQAAGDFMALSGESSVHTGRGRIKGAYAIIPFAVIAFMLLAVAARALVSHLRFRRLAGYYGERLPPSPLSIHRDRAQPRPRHRS